MKDERLSVGSRDPVRHEIPGDLSLKDIVVFLKRYWLTLVTITAVGLAVGVAAAVFMTPLYSAKTVVSPVTSEGAGSLSRLASQLGPLVGVLGDFGVGAGGSKKEVWLATLRSRTLYDTFIKENNLLPILFADRWDADLKTWRQRGGGAVAPTANDAILLFEKSVVSVAEDKRSGLVSVNVRWKDPELAARWANDLVSMANKFIRDRVIEESQRNIDYMDKELKKTNVIERQQILYRLIESRTNEIVMANGRPDYAFAVIDKAVAPDLDQYVSPNRPLLVLGGGLCGLSIGVLVALFVSAWRKSRVLN